MFFSDEIFQLAPDCPILLFRCALIFLCREEEPEDVPHGHITSLVSYMKQSVCSERRPDSDLSWRTSVSSNHCTDPLEEDYPVFVRFGANHSDPNNAVAP